MDRKLLLMLISLPLLVGCGTMGGLSLTDVPGVEVEVGRIPVPGAEEGDKVPVRGSFKIDLVEMGCAGVAIIPKVGSVAKAFLAPYCP